MKIKKDGELSLREETVLIALRNRELYGLQIVKALEQVTDGKRRIGLDHFTQRSTSWKRKGWSNLGGETKHRKKKGAARRKYYTITNTGERALREAEQVRNQLARWNRSPGEDIRMKAKKKIANGWQKSFKLGIKIIAELAELLKPMRKIN